MTDRQRRVLDRLAGHARRSPGCEQHAGSVTAARRSACPGCGTRMDEVERCRIELFDLAVERLAAEAVVAGLLRSTALAACAAKAAGVGPVEIHRLTRISRPTLNGYLKAAEGA